MPSDAEPRTAQALQTQATCTRRTAGHAPHRSSILLCHTGAPADWRQVHVMGVVDDVVTLAAGDELARFRTHAADTLAESVAEAGPEAHLNVRFGYLFLGSWPRDPEAVFSLHPADLPHTPCG